MLASTLSISTLERGARLVLDDLEDLLELLHLVVLGKDLRRNSYGQVLGQSRSYEYPLVRPCLDPAGVDGNIHTNWLGFRQG